MLIEFIIINNPVNVHTKNTKNKKFSAIIKILPSVNDFSGTLSDNIFFFSLFGNSFKKETDT